jgi:N-acetylglutamate synthase-like GNAT family acetyltransferase
MNSKSSEMEQFESFSQFQSLTEFHQHMDKWLADYKQEFSKGELVGFKQLITFAAVIPGVSNEKIATILNAIHEQYHGHGISRATFKRMLGRAKKLDILTVYETERMNGSQDSNLYIFHHFSHRGKGIYAKR